MVEDFPDTYEPSGFFVLRSPLLTVQEALLAISRKMPAGLEPQASARAVEDEIRATRACLVELVRRPEVREALLVASPSLDAALDVWIDKGGESGEGISKIDLSVMNYLLRMGCRSTPFGLFAGVSVGALGDATKLCLAPRGASTRHIRLDMRLLCSLAEALAEDLRFRAALRFCATPSLYPLADRLRYTRFSYRTDQAYPVVEVESSEPLLLVLRRSAERPAYPADLAEALRAGVEGVTAPQAYGFVEDLIENKLLLPEITPALTGEEPAEPIVRALALQPALAEPLRALEELSRTIRAITAQPLGAPATLYQAAVDAARALPFEVDPRYILQVDLNKPVKELQLGQAPVAELLRAAGLLYELGQVGDEPFSPLRRFIDRFTARYGAREVPLTEALDEDFGVGFSLGAEAPERGLLAGLPFDSAELRGGLPDARWQAFLAHKLSQSSRSVDAPIDIQPGEFDPGPMPEHPPLSSFVMCATLVATSVEAADAGNFSLVHPLLSHPSGAGMIARYCHANPDLSALLLDHLRREDELERDVILADVVHLAEGRAGNFMLRPVLRPYEIVCNGRSGAPRERQIEPADLLVSVVRSRAVLRSRRLGRRIAPRLTTSHDAYQDPTSVVYQFLDAVQEQDSVKAQWSWGMFAGREILPRVQSGRTILSLATWNIPQKTLRSIATRKGGPRLEGLRALRETLRIPVIVAVKEQYSLLPLHLDNPLCVEALLRMSAGQGKITLVEQPHLEEGALVDGPEGRYTHELLVPFLRRNPPAPAQRRDGEKERAAPLVAAPLIPGGPVLWMRVYAHSTNLEAVLLDALLPVLRPALEAGDIDAWHFSKFHGASRQASWGGVHLTGVPERLWSSVLPRLQRSLQPALASSTLSRVVVDTYDPARIAGAPLDPIARSFAEADSAACAEMLALLAEAEDADDRWRFIALGVDALLGDCGMDVVARKDFLSLSLQRLERAARAAPAYSAAFGLKSRDIVPELARLLAGGAAGKWVDRASQVLQRRSARLAPSLHELWGSPLDGALGQFLDAGLSSHTSRLVLEEPLKHQVVLHGLLVRAYQAQLARGVKA